MFTSIKAQFNTYKWTIIIVAFGLLTLGLGWQYHRASTLEVAQESLKDKNEQLEGRVGTITRSFNDYKESTDKALGDLEELRQSLSDINEATALLKARIDQFKTTQPTPGGANAKQIEDEANALMQEAFDRLDAASRGESK